MGSEDNAEGEEEEGGARALFLPSPPLVPIPLLSADFSELMQSEAMALVQVWMVSSCLPSLSCEEG